MPSFESKRLAISFNSTNTDAYHMKLSTWATQQGISYITAYRWFKAGKIANAKQLDTGTIIVEDLKDDVIVIIGKADKVDEIVKKIKGVLGKC